MSKPETIVAHAEKKVRDHLTKAQHCIEQTVRFTDLFARNVDLAARWDAVADEARAQLVSK